MLACTRITRATFCTSTPDVVGLVAVTHAIAGGLIWYKNKVRRK